MQGLGSGAWFRFAEGGRKGFGTFGLILIGVAEEFRMRGVVYSGASES